MILCLNQLAYNSKRTYICLLMKAFSQFMHGHEVESMKKVKKIVERDASQMMKEKI